MSFAASAIIIFTRDNVGRKSSLGGVWFNMGIEINQRAFSSGDHDRFGERLESQLSTLAGLLKKPGFGQGAQTLGAELELYIVDEDGHPAHLNQELLASLQDPQLTLELNRYNLEFNLSPQHFADKGLYATEQEMLEKIAALSQVADSHRASIVPIGILPTLESGHFGRHALTDRVRYHALVDQLIKRRGSDFEIDIDGPDPLKLQMSDITLEGANTSFQLHWRVEPKDYADTFNALQLFTPLVLAISANSPGLFGHDLWDETRIPLFKQSIDTRQLDPYSWREPARVSYGQGWVRQGALELFEESVRLFPPLLPCLDEVAGSMTDSPELAELRLHQSTVWLWNRPVYDDAGGGHLRIELRALPAGPTAIDMLAGGALALGLARYYREQMTHLLPALPFTLAERNFYRAAQAGIDAQLIWPRRGQQSLEVKGVLDILRDLLPHADEGLQLLGVSQFERERYLGVIEKRISSGITGARWQRLEVARRQKQGIERKKALAQMLSAYRELSASNQPVAEWPR
jgi:gamma-glutamyl:cysteine ligase YbdK (ATP-grasp superfamily)